MNIDLSGKRAVIGGSSKGIGRAIAEKLSGAGAQVLLLARGEQALHELAVKLPGSGHQYHSVDFTDRDQVEKTIEVVKQFSPDILINNAGGPKPGMISGANQDEFLTALDMHLFASHKLALAALPKMRDRRFGRIVNIISTSVKIPLHGLGVSNTVRGAVASWAKTLSNEVAPFGITVNSILPGFVETDRLSEIIAVNSEKSGKKKAEIIKQMLAQVPAQRFGKPEEAGALACFLCSDFASYINGVTIPLDGGRTGSI